MLTVGQKYTISKSSTHSRHNDCSMNQAMDNICPRKMSRSSNSRVPATQQLSPKCGRNNLLSSTKASPHVNFIIQPLWCLYITILWWQQKPMPHAYQSSVLNGKQSYKMPVLQDMGLQCSFGPHIGLWMQPWRLTDLNRCNYSWAGCMDPALICTAAIQRDMDCSRTPLAIPRSSVISP